ncbi:MAG: MarR family transcriptional regulator [Bacillota bacterium]
MSISIGWIMDAKITAKLLMATGQLMDIKFFRAVLQQSKTGLSPMQMRVMFVLRRRNSLSMSALADEMHMPKQQVTLLVDKLFQEQFVARECGAEDRRVINIRLTETGQEFVVSREAEVLEIFAARLNQLSVADLKELTMTFENVHTILQKIV